MKNILFLSCLLLFLAQPTFAQKKGKKNKKAKTEDPAQLVQAQDLFIQANKAKILGDTDKALVLFAESITLNPNNPAAAFELAKIYNKRKEYKAAMEYARVAANGDDNNHWYQYLYAELLAEQGDFNGAAGVYEKLTRTYPENPEHYLDWAYVLAYGQDYKGALKVLDALEAKVGKSEEVSLQKYELYMAVGQADKAIGEIEALNKSFPAEVRYYQMLADIHQRSGNETKAMEVYRSLSEFDPENPYARLAMADFYRKNGEGEKAFGELKSAFENRDLPVEPKIQLLFSNGVGSSGVPAEMQDQNLELAKILTQTHSDNAQAFLLLGHLYMDKKNGKEAKAAYKKSLKINSNQLDVWHQIFVMESIDGNFEQLAKDSKEAIDYFPNQSLVYYFNGMANNNLGNYDKAAKSLKRAANIGSNEPETLSDIYSQLGGIYNSKKEYDRSDEYFDKALEAFPRNTLVLNNYSYFLALRDEKLDKAKEMAKLANEIEPGVSSFEDTYAWLLYQTGEFAMAKTWIEKALASGGKTSAVVVDHYGDILYRLKDIEGAVTQWQKAKELGLESEVIDRKIQDRKVY